MPRELAELDEDARAAMRQRTLGFVFQSFQLLPALTALENVMLPLELKGTADASERPTSRPSSRAASSSASRSRALSSSIRA